MAQSTCTTSRTGAIGEDLVSIALMRFLNWTPRKEERDEGIDHNVEIPPDAGHP